MSNLNLLKGKTVVHRFNNWKIGNPNTTYESRENIVVSLQNTEVKHMRAIMKNQSNYYFHDYFVYFSQASTFHRTFIQLSLPKEKVLTEISVFFLKKFNNFKNSKNKQCWNKIWFLFQHCFGVHKRVHFCSLNNCR